MKSVRIIPSMQVDAFLYSLWKTKEFKDSHRDPTGFVNYVATLFAKYPRIVYEATDEIEHAHFTSWMNMLQLRDVKYDNPYVHDVYLLHEIWHMCTMPYMDSTFYAWWNKIVENELEASLVSETIIYLQLKAENRDIRNKTFDKPLFVDKFMNLATRIKEVPYDELFVHPMLKEMVATRRALTYGLALSEDFDDETLSYFKRYGQQNFKFCEVWKDWFDFVELLVKSMYIALDDFNALKYSSHEKEEYEYRIVEGYLQVLDRKKVNDVYFFTLAKKFHDIYTNNNTMFGVHRSKEIVEV